MTSPRVAPAAAKLLAGLGLKLRIAAACVTLLVIGAWLAPSNAGTVTTSQERAAPLLEEQVMQREPVALFQGFQHLAGQITHRGVAIRTAQSRARGDAARFAAPGAFGVVVDGSTLLTHAAALDGLRTAQVEVAADRIVDADLVAFDPPTGLVLLRLREPTAGTVARIAGSAPEVGAVLVAAGRADGVELTVPLFVTSVAPQHYGVSGGAELAPGMPVYDGNGELVAIASGGATAHRVADVLERLRRGEPPTSFGMTLQPLDAPLQRALGTDGVVVVAVVAGGPAAAAAVREGDVLTAIAGVPVTATDDVASRIAAIPSGTETEIAVWRGGRTLEARVTAADAYDVAMLAQMAGAAVVVQAGAIFDAAALTAARVPPGAAVLRLDGAAITSASQARRLLRGAPREAVALIEYRGARTYVVIGTAR